eukprot:TRINITY_DN2007_c0_g1_i7.p6 TRINITY_DN2007_c0_g1~~TRINITY_DN2007_c0_g1_i7.p6  ORF type:complete len:130 (-),score=19.38 TRINITY_DN2007_c0_g1_i7:366-755(-)
MQSCFLLVLDLERMRFLSPRRPVSLPTLFFGDEDNVCYEALQTRFGFDFVPIVSTFIERIQKDLNKDFSDFIRKNYKFLMPKRTGQVTIQGALLVAKGEETVWLRYEKGPGDHANLDDILATVQTTLGN